MVSNKNYFRVCKFGGTSLATPLGFCLVKNIVLAGEDRDFIVASAQGKRFVTDIKVTDLLILLFNYYRKGENIDKLFSEIKIRHLYIRDSLQIDIDIEEEFKIIKNNLELGKEYLISRGEYLNAKLLAKYLNYNFFDAKDFYIFSNGKINLEKTKPNLKGLPQKSVIGGFYGSDEKTEKIELFSRGGGDISGAILALAKNALYENFTDTNGVLSADPKFVKNTVNIKELTYDNLATMSQLGAGVIHKSVSKILKNSNITLNVLNTFSANDTGTLVYDNAIKCYKNRLAVAIKNNIVSVIYNVDTDLVSELTRLILDIKKEDINIKKVSINFKKCYIKFETKSSQVVKLANLLHKKTT